MQYFFQETAIKREREENCFNRFTKKKDKNFFFRFFHNDPRFQPKLP